MVALEGSNMFEPLIRLRNVFEQVSFILGITVTLGLMVIALLRFLPWPAVIPGALMALSFSGFIVMRRSGRGGMSGGRT